MATTDERAHIEYALNEINESPVRDMNAVFGLGELACPLCQTTLLADLSYDEIEKIQHWTVAQLVAWHNLQKRSGIDAHELLAQTSVQARPGIGALVNPTVLGLNLNGIFVGIEPDGYTHS